MKPQTRLVPLILFSLLISSSPSCKRKPPSLEAIDRIDRRSNLPLVQPINRDLAQIRERASLVVLAPYNSTSYFIYQGQPLGYEYELLQVFAKDLGVPLQMVVVTDPKSLFPLLNSGEGDIAAARLIPPVGPTVDIKQYAGELGWDWRLLASQAFQESRFKPAARSWAGATGLLQLMPATAREFGVQNALDPSDNVKGAVKFLQWLQRYWEKRVPDEKERLKFILASYNCGAGHVDDAQRLTEKYGGNPQVWEDVSYWLLQKSTQQYSSDAVVKFGFCRGLEPVNYVSNILERFNHYKQFVVT